MAPQLIDLNGTGFSLRIWTALSANRTRANNQTILPARV
jgi:hypothetical protein